MDSESDTQEKIKELIIARLRSAPPHLGIVIGSGQQTFSPEDVVKEIESGSKIGEEYIDLEMDFLRALKDGVLYE